MYSKVSFESKLTPRITKEFDTFRMVSFKIRSPWTGDTVLDLLTIKVLYSYWEIDEISKIVTFSSPSKLKALQEEIDRHLESGAMSKIPFLHNPILSRVFTVHKNCKNNRLVIDLHRINLNIPNSHFTMKTRRS